MVAPDRSDRGSAGSYGAAGAGSGDQGDALESAVGQVQQKAGEAVEQAQQKAGEVVGQIREQASVRLEDQKGVLAEGVRTVADALRHTGDTLREEEQAAVAQYADRTAEQVERFYRYLNERDLGQITADVENFARRQPALFLGGSFVLGLLAVRFLKSSGQAAAGGSSAGRSGDQYGYRAKVYGLQPGGAGTYGAGVNSGRTGGTPAYGSPGGAGGPGAWRDTDATTG